MNGWRTVLWCNVLILSAVSVWNLEENTIQSHADTALVTLPYKTIPMKVTAYCPCKKCCGAHANGYTSVGDIACRTNGVAADPTLLPYGTILFIPGLGYREVDDTGGAMRQAAKRGEYHIDVRFKSHKEARQWGMRRLNVKILR